MRKFTRFMLLFFISGFFLICTAVTGQVVLQETANSVAKRFLNDLELAIQITDVEELTDRNENLAWIFNCHPRGFVVVPTTMVLPPVLAYSIEGNFNEGEAWTTFLPVFIADIKNRIQYADHSGPEMKKNTRVWNDYFDPAGEPKLFQQWPPEGWSPTGGWLFTNWTQTAPYNAMCPMDPQTHQRSVAGCPATAMAQILNFHHTINNTRFSDADDYYHSFGAGNQYWIDDAWAERGFPSWPQLNEYLDTLDAHYLNQVPLTNNDKAAITYACGVAAKQVYRSSVSGTYGIDQAYDAFIRFGFSDAQLVYPSNPGLTSLLAQNIMMALPAQLGLVNPEGTAGHNVVVDGYNSDEMYHFNFGWGGSANGWYTMPPTSIPYNLTVIEGVVLDINLSNAPVGISTEYTAKHQFEIRYYPQSNSLQIIIPEGETKTFHLTVVSQTGQVILLQQISPGDHFGEQYIELPKSLSGLFIVTIANEGEGLISKKFIRLPG